MVDTLAYVLDKYKTEPSNHRGRIELDDIGREDLAELFGELGFKTGVEVGVQKGRYSRTLCRKNPKLTLYCVDPWLEYSDIRADQKEVDGFEKDARRRLRQFNCIIMKMTSVLASDQFEDESLDFVYIDGQHDFINTTQDLHVWTPKVRSGGIIAGHDYLKPRRPCGLHTAFVVDAWTQAYSITPWFRLGCYADNKENKDGHRSYFWVKA